MCEQCAGFWRHVYAQDSNYTIHLDFSLMIEGGGRVYRGRTQPVAARIEWTGLPDAGALDHLFHSPVVVPCRWACLLQACSVRVR